MNRRIISALIVFLLLASVTIPAASAVDPIPKGGTFQGIVVGVLAEQALQSVNENPVVQEAKNYTHEVIKECVKINQKVIEEAAECILSRSE